MGRVAPSGAWNCCAQRTSGRSGLQGSQQGIAFPDHSLFRFVARTQCFRRKYALEGTYPTLVDIQVAIFPVFFPVSREFRQRRVRARLRPPPYLFSRVNPLLLVELVLCRPIETAPF